MNQQEEKKIHIEGMDAYEADKDYEKDCPYRKGSTKRDVWQHGWTTAFELESMED